MNCPYCGEEAAALFRSARQIEAELALRRRVFARGRDLTDVVLGVPADILRCQRCGILIRAGAPGDDYYSDDYYSWAFLRSLHEAHVRAFLAKGADYRPLLAPEARVVEIGSYAGGFLRAATEWGWRPSGIDIGRDTARFTASLGFDMRERFEFKALDGVFIWNCFEQLSDPRAALGVAHAALRDAGLLLLRVPDADAYLRGDLRIVATNGLLGWPHRFGFGVEALRSLAAQHGFAFRRVLRRPPLPPLTATQPGWIELTFRRVSSISPARATTRTSPACAAPAAVDRA